LLQYVPLVLFNCYVYVLNNCALFSGMLVCFYKSPEKRDSKRMLNLSCLLTAQACIVELLFVSGAVRTTLARLPVYPNFKAGLIRLTVGYQVHEMSSSMMPSLCLILVR
jgi:hypothetical protein